MKHVSKFSKKKHTFSPTPISLLINCIHSQLYQEQVYDLLSPTRATLDIREDGRGICIPGLTEISVSDFTSTLQCLMQVFIFYNI